MSRKRTALFLLVAILLAPAAFSQALEQVQVLVGSDRSALIKVHRTEGESDLSGNLKAGVDLAEGSSALRADLRLEDAEELGDGTVDAFLKMSAATTEMIGRLDLPMPAGDEGAPDRLDELAVTFETLTGQETQYARGELEIVSSSDKPLPTVTVDGTAEGSLESFSGTVDYSVTVSEEQAGEIPVSDLSLTLAEEAADTGEGETVTTTLTLSVTAPKGSQLEQQLRMAPGFRPMIEGRLRQLGLQVERIEIPPVEETESALTASATVAVRDLRRMLAERIDTAGPAMGRDTLMDPQAMSAALEKMMEPRLDTLAITMNVDGTRITGQVGGELTRLREFFAGYMNLVQTLAKEGTAPRAGDEAGESSPYMTAWQEVNMETTARSLEVLSESDMSFGGQGEFELSSADGKVNVDGELDLSVRNYEDYAEKARAAGLPVADTALVTADLRLTDADRLDGRVYAYSDVQLLTYYRTIVTEALARVDGAKDASSIVEEANLEDAAFSLNLDGQELEVRGYAQTTPLTRASRAIVEEVVPRFEGTPDGAYLDYTFRSDGAGEGDILVHATDFMPNRSAAEIREALDLPETADVQMDVAPAAVALPRVDRPRVRVSGRLASVRSSAQDLPGPGAGGGAGPNWMLIVGGLLVIVLIGVGLAARRRRL